MNIPRPRLIILLAIVSFVSACERKDETALDSILKERDAVLSDLLANREKQYATGMVSDEGVVSARLALWSFRRDTVKSNTEKIKNQEAIVGIYEKKLEMIKFRYTQGLSIHDEILKFTDSLLQAKQTLEELRLKKDRG